MPRGKVGAVPEYFQILLQFHSPRFPPENWEMYKWYKVSAEVLRKTAGGVQRRRGILSVFAAGSGTRLYENTKFFNGKSSTNFGVFVKSPLWLWSCGSRSCLPVPGGVRRAQVCSAGHPGPGGDRHSSKHQEKQEKGSSRPCLRRQGARKAKVDPGTGDHRPAGGPGPCRSPAPAFRAFLCPNPPKSLDLGDP